MELSAYLRAHARTLPGKQQLVISSFAKALEVIPRTICDNAGLDATDVLNKLRMLHARGETWAGVSVDDDDERDADGSGGGGEESGAAGSSPGVANNMDRFVWEPALVKVNALEGAVEAACIVLSVDETVTSPQAQVRSPLSFLSLRHPGSSPLTSPTLSHCSKHSRAVRQVVCPAGDGGSFRRSRPSRLANASLYIFVCTNSNHQLQRTLARSTRYELLTTARLRRGEP